MRAGISTACFYPQPVEDILPILAGLGVHAIEIFLTPKASFPSSFMRAWAPRRAALGWRLCPSTPTPR